VICSSKFHRLSQATNHIRFEHRNSIACWTKSDDNASGSAADEYEPYEEPGQRHSDTPIVIEPWRVLALNSARAVCGDAYDLRLTEVSCAHKAAIPVDGKITLNAEVAEVAEASVAFQVFCVAEQSKKLVGEGRLIFNVIEK
jgi:hypothetical protein